MMFRLTEQICALNMDTDTEKSKLFTWRFLEFTKQVDYFTLI